jgi:TrkA domain protein
MPNGCRPGWYAGRRTANLERREPNRTGTVTMTIERTALPGVGISHAITTVARQRLGVISHVTGRRDLVLYDVDDPEQAAQTVVLAGHEAHQVADLLTGTVTVDHVTDLERRLTGVVAARIRIPAGSAYDGRPLGHTRARTRTGASIVAVIRGADVIAAPGPDFVLRHEDRIVAVADQPGIAALTELIAG